jgi:hypothetical protein
MPPREKSLLGATPLALCAAFVLALSGGCSYLFVDAPPERHRQLPYFECTKSRAWPVVDTVIAATYGIETAAFIVGASASKAERGPLAGAAAAAAATAVLFTASAFSGYGKVSECREATDELQLRLIRMQPAPGAVPPGAGPWQPQGASQYDPWVTRPAQPFGAPPAPPPPTAPPSPPTPQMPEEKR